MSFYTLCNRSNIRNNWLKIIYLWRFIARSLALRKLKHEGNESTESTHNFSILPVAFNQIDTQESLLCFLKNCTAAESNNYVMYERPKYLQNRPNGGHLK